jgi:REP element-mobilizing transposase RayT
LTPQLRAELEAYLVKVLHENGCPPLQIGSVSDHVHSLFGLSRILTVAQVVQLVKTSTSKWLKTKGPSMGGFCWQSGYGAFSVSQSSADSVVAYIRNQERHHRQVPFQDEFRALLQRHHIEYDERYVWD